MYQLLIVLGFCIQTLLAFGSVTETKRQVHNYDHTKDDVAIIEFYQLYYLAASVCFLLACFLLAYAFDFNPFKTKEKRKEKKKN